MATNRNASGRAHIIYLCTPPPPPPPSHTIVCVYTHVCVLQRAHPFLLILFHRNVRGIRARTFTRGIPLFLGEQLLLLRDKLPDALAGCENTTTAHTHTNTGNTYRKFCTRRTTSHHTTATITRTYTYANTEPCVCVGHYHTFCGPGRYTAVEMRRRHCVRWLVGLGWGGRVCELVAACLLTCNCMRQ